MSAFVVLSAAAALVAAGVCVVLAARTWRITQTLAASVADTRRQLQPLMAELQAETAVMSVEMQALRADAEQLQRERHEHRERRRRRARRGRRRPIRSRR